MRKALIISVLLFIGPFLYAGGVRFASEKLAEISRAMGVELRESAEPQHFIWSDAGVNYPVVVECREDEIVHIGLDLFTGEIRQEYPVVGRFVERYMLESEALHVKDGRIQVSGFVSDIYSTAPEDLVMQYASPGDGRGLFSVLKKTGEKLFSISFPLQMEVLAGMDKIELENDFLEELQHYSGQALQEEDPKARIHGVDPSQRLLMMLTGEAPSQGYIVHLIQNRYGYQQAELDVPLSTLLRFCLDKGCTPRAGIEAAEGEYITVSLFMEHPEFGYCHTFQFTVPRQLLKKKGGSMTALAFTYTPIHNLRR